MAKGRLRSWYRSIPKLVRRVIVLVIGGTILLIGLVMVITPGPAVVVIPIGLAILALEFAWARLWLRRVRRTASNTYSKLYRSGKPRTITQETFSSSNQ